MRHHHPAPWTLITLLAACLFGGSAPATAHEGHVHADKARPETSQAIIRSHRSAASRWGANYFPNVPLLTQDGKSVRFFDDLIKGKVVVINFIYSSCTGSCPLSTARLAKVQQMLGERVGRDVFFYSITIDPERDRPEVLKKYAEKYHAGPGWLFLTGKEDDIMTLRVKLGMFIAGLDQKLKDHSMSLLMGNQATGQWMKTSPMENPYYLATKVGTWLTNWKAPSAYVAHNYANAPALQLPTLGENLFRTRCSACHTIGSETARLVGAKGAVRATRHMAGPDLLGITRRRDRAWLERWLADPEKMIAGKDPVALKIYAQYNQKIMPNLRLGPREVKEAIEYMEVETRRVEGEAAKASSRASAAAETPNESGRVAEAARSL